VEVSINIGPVQIDTKLSIDSGFRYHWITNFSAMEEVSVFQHIWIYKSKILMQKIYRLYRYRNFLTSY